MQHEKTLTWNTKPPSNKKTNGMVKSGAFLCMSVLFLRRKVGPAWGSPAAAEKRLGLECFGVGEILPLGFGNNDPVPII